MNNLSKLIELHKLPFLTSKELEEYKYLIDNMMDDLLELVLAVTEERHWRDKLGSQGKLYIDEHNSMHLAYQKVTDALAKLRGDKNQTGGSDE